MAKTQGTAGRTPRKRIPLGKPPKRPKGPPITDLDFRYGTSGSGITESEARRLTFYPDAKEGESTPISERTVRPTKGKNKETYDRTVEQIDKVHNYPAKSAPIVMKTKKLKPGLY